MELVPDTYSPSIDKDGNYVDNLYTFTKDMYCPCSNKLYHSKYLMATHTNTKMHKNWIQTLNNDKVNYYKVNIELNDLIKNQRLIIAQLEKELKQKITMIDSLTDVIHKYNHQPKNEFNLLDL